MASLTFGPSTLSADRELKYLYLPKRRVYQICMRAHIMTLENLLVALLSGSTRLLLQCGSGVTEEYCIC